MAFSTGCANSVFRKAADDGKKEFGTNAADLMRRDFYVDDGFKLVQDTSTVVNFIQKTQDVCRGWPEITQVKHEQNGSYSRYCKGTTRPQPD